MTQKTINRDEMLYELSVSEQWEALCDEIDQFIVNADRTLKLKQTPIDQMKYWCGYITSLEELKFEVERRKLWKKPETAK